MAFSMNKSQSQATSATSADVVEFGKDKFELEQFILRNLNNALDINNESSYLGSFNIKVASNDTGFFYTPTLPVSYSLDSQLALEYYIHTRHSYHRIMLFLFLMIQPMKIKHVHFSFLGSMASRRA